MVYNNNALTANFKIVVPFGDNDLAHLGHMIGGKNQKKKDNAIPLKSFIKTDRFAISKRQINNAHCQRDEIKMKTDRLCVSCII